MSCRSPHLKNVILYKTGTLQGTLTEDGSWARGVAWTRTRLAWSLGRRERLTSTRVRMQRRRKPGSQPYIPDLPCEARHGHFGFLGEYPTPQTIPLKDPAVNLPSKAHSPPELEGVCQCSVHSQRRERSRNRDLEGSELSFLNLTACYTPRAGG